MEDGEFKIDLSAGFATTGGTDCPITSIGLFKDALGATPFTDSFITIDDLHVIKVIPFNEAADF